MEKKLILFDIDGTLLTTGGAGEQALRASVQERFGRSEDLAGIEIAGRTDSAIARALLAKHDVPDTPENLTALFDGYIHHLTRLLPMVPGRLLPGVISLLESLRARPDIVLGLLTGNLARGAELKLTHYGVWDFFEFGAFADDHHDRNQLGRFACARALERHGIEFPPERIFILGDTPHDIACARAIGARAIAIATGAYPRAALARFNPDFLFDDLESATAVLATIF
jgi:phosphoglycolate phosphatase